MDARPTTRVTKSYQSIGVVGQRRSCNKRTAPDLGAPDTPPKERRVGSGTNTYVSEKMCPDMISHVTTDVIRQLRQRPMVHSSSSSCPVTTDEQPACLPVKITTTAGTSTVQVSCMFCSTPHRAVDTFNDVETEIDYHTHRGFWQTANESWSRYKRSLRQAYYMNISRALYNILSYRSETLH